VKALGPQAPSIKQQATSCDILSRDKINNGHKDQASSGKHLRQFVKYKKI